MTQNLKHDLYRASGNRDANIHLCLTLQAHRMPNSIGKTAKSLQTHSLAPNC